MARRRGGAAAHRTTSFRRIRIYSPSSRSTTLGDGPISAIKATKKAGIQVYSVAGSPGGKATIVDGTMTRDGVQVPIQEAEVAFKQASNCSRPARSRAAAPGFRRKTWTTTLPNGLNIGKATYLPSFLLTKEYSEKKRKWQ